MSLFQAGGALYCKYTKYTEQQLSTFLIMIENEYGQQSASTALMTYNMSRLTINW